MATTQSTEKILNFLENQKTPITKTEITIGCSLPSASVTQVIELLIRMNQIETWTNGKVTLIKLKQVQKESDKNATTIPN